jgi:DNA-binding IclR family transcriptional regulator
VRCQYRYVEQSSGVGVLDKAVLVLDAVHAGAHSLAHLTERTGLSRATAHRLAVALEVHGLLARDRGGRWAIGPLVGKLAGNDTLLERAEAILARLRDVTGESAQLYRRQGLERICIAASERGSGLRDTVPVGAALPMSAGSAAQVLLAFSDEPAPPGAAFGDRALSEVRRRGWAHSVGEREPGVASVSAPVLAADGTVVAAISVSGPIERLGRQPGRLHAAAVVAAARELSG